MSNNEDRNLLSLELIPTSIDAPEEGIWANLRKAIELQVKRDGIREDSILPSQTKEDVFRMAVNYVYDDVSEFYYWIFNTEDEFGRNQYVQTQPMSGGKFAGPKYNALRKVVAPVVEDNLEAMRDADEITPEQDVAGLSENITDNLTAYIINWQNWFYDRKIEDDLDAYYEYRAEHVSIYEDDDYGDLTNLLDPRQYDGETDVPHLS